MEELQGLVPGKLYYSISEVAAILGENTSLVRFWSDTFSRYVKTKRTPNKNNRMYDEKAIRNLKLIHYLVKEQGMTLEGASRRLQDNKDGLDNKIEIVDRLKAIRSELQQICSQM